jgi:hypothetical protein
LLLSLFLSVYCFCLCTLHFLCFSFCILFCFFLLSHHLTVLAYLCTCAVSH